MKKENIVDGVQNAPHRSLFHALGLTEEEQKRPLIGIVSSYNEIVPGHMNLDKIVDAVKLGAVYEMPRGFEAWDSPVPSGVLGAVWAAHVLHPDLVSREDYVSAAKAMYETFYGFTPDEAAL